MNTVNTPQIESVLRRQVLDILDLSKAGQFSKSLGTVKSARSIYPKNIFLIALEKQLEKLLAMTYTPALTDPGRQKELLESIPNLVQRAADAMEKDEPVPTNRPADHLEEREAAFARLKDEYFQLADSHVKSGEYQDALQEIKRVLILDPENSTAKEYQKKINEFVELNARASQAPQTAVQQEQKIRPEPEAPQGRGENSPDARRAQKEIEKVVPQHPVESAISSKHKKRSLNTLVLVGVPALLLCVAAAYFLLAPEDTNSQPVASPVVNKSVATIKGTSEPPKEEPVQPTKQESPEATLPASAADQQSAPAESQGVQPSEAKGIVAAERPSPSKLAIALQNSEPAAANAVPKSTAEPLSAVKEPSPNIRTKGTTTNSYDDTGSRSLKTPEARAPMLAKLPVTATSPVTYSVKASPPPITYTERKPQIVRLVTPAFPEAARQAGASGEVLVSVQINPQGKPIRAKILRSSSELFNAAVIDAVMHSQYSPGVMPSGPVTTWLTVPFMFKQTSND